MTLNRRMWSFKNGHGRHWMSPRPVGGHPARQSERLQIDRHLERRIRCGAIDDAGVTRGCLRVLVAEHILHGAQIVRVAIGQGGTSVAKAWFDTRGRFAPARRR